MRAVEDDSDESDVDEDPVPSLSESLVTPMDQRLVDLRADYEGRQLI